MIIRKSVPQDEDSIWNILEPVIRSGETFPLPRDMTREAALAYWLAPEKQTFVAEDEGEIVGTYYMRANQAGGGGHVCNCGYITSENARRRGIARRMCQQSLQEALKSGFRAMQYNCVVSTNEGAIRLWKDLGFGIVGTLPGAFNHPSLGDVDAFVMYQKL